MANPSDADRTDDAQGRYAYEGLERAIHEKARLGILTSLAAHPQGLLFADLKQLCALTDGNLNRHLKVLCEHGLVDIAKGSQDGRPQTLCTLTDLGRSRLLQYVGELQRVVADAARAAESPRSHSPARRSAGWSPA